jgi:hypothetical protein
MKRTVYAKLEGFDKDSLEGPLADVIVTLQEIQSANPDTPDMSIVIDTEDEYGCTYARAYIEYLREETDEEEARRKATEAAHIAYKKQQYEALKKEFG